MKFLTEVVQDNIRLTSHQKSILATILQAGAPVADDVLSQNRNLSGALRQLVKMRMVENVETDVYDITDIGMKFASESGIVDEMGGITDEGAAFVIGSKVEPANTDRPMAESVGTFKDYLLLM